MEKNNSLWLFVSVSSFLLLWEAISRSGAVSITLFPPPSRVFFALLELFRGGFILDIIVSFKRMLFGLFIGSVLGVVAGIFTARVRIVDLTISPIINVLRAFPPVALIPLLIVWFGIGESAKIISISFAVFFPVWINSYLGAQRVSRHYITAAKTLTKSHFKILRTVVFPATIPFAIAGIRNGIAIAFIMVYVAELAGASAGIGYQISVSHLNYAIAKMIAALFTLGLLAAVTDSAFHKTIQHLLPWLTKTTSV